MYLRLNYIERFLIHDYIILMCVGKIQRLVRKYCLTCKTRALICLEDNKTS